MNPLEMMVDLHGFTRLLKTNDVAFWVYFGRSANKYFSNRIGVCCIGFFLASLLSTPSCGE